MPISCSLLSLPSSVNRGASSWQRTHQEAQTLTTLTLPLNMVGSSPGTCPPPLTRPSSAGSALCGAGRPINAEGIRDGSPLPSRNQKITARPANASSGSAIKKERRRGVVSVVDGSVIFYPHHLARNALLRLRLPAHAVAVSGVDNRSRSRQ